MATASGFGQASRETARPAGHIMAVPPLLPPCGPSCAGAKADAPSGGAEASASPLDVSSGPKAMLLYAEGHGARLVLHDEREGSEAGAPGRDIGSHNSQGRLGPSPGYPSVQFH
jgi:hypothetical protein